MRIPLAAMMNGSSINKLLAAGRPEPGLIHERADGCGVQVSPALVCRPMQFVALAALEINREVLSGPLQLCGGRGILSVCEDANIRFDLRQ